MDVFSTNQYIMHGMTAHPLYNTWKNIRQRCNNPKNTAYQYYGGKGVKLCVRWNDFTKFVEDMGSKPTKLHTIDRKDSNGNYEPNNCRWATKKEQSANTKIRSDNKSGVKGVGWETRLSKWRAYTYENKNRIYLGVYSEVSQAKRALEAYHEQCV